MTNHRQVTDVRGREPTARPVASKQRGSILGDVVLAATLVLVALNLRSAIVAVGPLTGAIEADTGLGATAIGMLTTVPLLCLGAFAAAAPVLARHIGFEKAVLAATALIALGIAARLSTPLWALFLGTVIAGSGIAIANVIVPSLIKRDFPHRLGAMLSLYSVSLQTGATIASGITVPIGAAVGAGWRPSLAIWGLPAAAAVLAWLPFALRRRVVSEATSSSRYAVWRTSLGWACVGFIGLQSAVYFSLTAWMPSLLLDGGMSEERAGLMLSIVGVAGIVGGLPMPLLAARMRNQQPLVALGVVAFLTGLVGLLLAPVTLAPVWSVLLGLAQGGCLSLALTLFTLRSRTADGSARLSGTAQTGGYLIAAVGPLLVGAVSAVTGGWTVPLIVLVLLLVPMAASGWVIARPRYVEDEAHPA